MQNGLKEGGRSRQKEGRNYEREGMERKKEEKGENRKIKIGIRHILILK